jgi:hypothetical protein
MPAHLVSPDDQDPRPSGRDRCRDDRAQLVAVDRLRHDPLTRKARRVGEGRDEDRRQVSQARVRPDRPERVDPVQTRHQHIQRDEVKALGPQPVEGVPARVDLHRLDSERRELLGDQPRQARLVVDYEHPPSGHHRRGRSPRPIAVAGRCRGDGGARRDRQIDGEDRSDSDLALEIDRPAVEVDERLDDRQAETGSRLRARPLTPVEALEDARPLARRHPATVVGHRDRQAPCSGSQCDSQTAAVGRVDVGVGQQVRDDLPDPGGIDIGVRELAVDVEVQRLVLLREPRRHQLGDLRQDLPEVGRPADELHVVGLELGDVEQVVDEVDQTVGRQQDDPHELALARRQPLRVAEQLDVSLDRGERAAKLVRRRRHELRLRPLEPSPLADVANRPDHASPARGQSGCRHR